MPATRQPNFTPSADLSERVREKIRSGEYASESDLIAESLAALDERDANLDDWLREAVIPAYDSWKASPSRAASIEDAFARPDARIAGRQFRHD